MKCTYTIINNRGLLNSIVIERDKLFIIEGENKQQIDASSEKCFNTLISLFALKESWINRRPCKHPLCIVQFESNNKVEIFKFNNDMPDNFSFFVAFISKLVGDSI